MNVQELTVVFQRLEQLYIAAGAAAPAKDLRSVMRLFEDHGKEDLKFFIAETKSFLNRSSVSKSKAKAGLNQDCVSTYVKKLLAADVDQTKFDVTFNEMKSNRKVKKLEWHTIANQYRNGIVDETHIYKFKTIEEARMFIRKTFAQRFESASKRGILDRINRWPSDWTSTENKK